MLRLHSIQKVYETASEQVHALRGVDLCFRQREFVSILGPSGCGKTTLLNIIGGLDHYSGGDLIINGKSTKTFSDRDWDVYRNHRVGFIFQSYNLIPHQTILGNVELALTIAGISRRERTERAKRVLDRVGLSGQYYKKPNQLSGGQCQRVAIARALVNDPEILLADEPTGALDTVTSVQIMDLIREISGERLVIMVTHNPALAKRYSNRIINLLDGRVQSDTRPFSAESERIECEHLRRGYTIETVRGRFGRKKQVAVPIKTIAGEKKEKAKMSFWTAFRLSARNLISKKGRTAMVGIAGSIGIIGIAMVLAFSAGIKGYVASMQDDMLSGNPITIEETTLDFNAMSDMMDHDDKADIVKQPNRVYINSMVEYLARMNKNINSLIVENELTKDYIDYVKAMPSEYYAAMLLDYGIDMTNAVYTDFTESAGGSTQNLSINALTSIYTSVLKDTDFSDYASYVSTLAPSLQQAPNSEDYIASQYDLVAGTIATGKNEIMLVLNHNDELSDLLLARLGYYTLDEFFEIVNKATAEDGTYDEAIYRDSFSYDELLGKTFTWYPNNTIFTKSVVSMPQAGDVTTFSYNYTSDSFSKDDSVELRVVGILTAKENISYGCLSSGIYYTEALTEHILTTNADSEIVHHLQDEQASALMAQTAYRIYYTYTYRTYEGEEASDMGYVGAAMTMSDMLGSGMMGGMGGSGSTGGAGGSGATIDMSSLRERFIRNLGGNDLANNVSIFPVTFDSKDTVTDYLDRWNDENVDITMPDGRTLTYAERSDVTYGDTLELIINIINTMIDIVSYALIAFTSISLVVSTVMIGIITYVSVVERIKEIGVIRSLGGRKKDVSHLFNAETFIIGALAGLFGVGMTYGICEIANAILYPLIGIRRIALLPVSNAILLVLLSILLTTISGLLPARSAAKKDPVVALRTE